MGLDDYIQADVLTKSGTLKDLTEEMCLEFLRVVKSMSDYRKATFDDLMIAAQTLYGEARGEPRESQAAVAWVIRNRAMAPKWWGRGVREVCLKPYQFSCWNKLDPNRERIERANLGQIAPLYEVVLAVFTAAQVSDPTGGATHYHTIAEPAGRTQWPPHWATRLTETARIGAHVFYK